MQRKREPRRWDLDDLEIRGGDEVENHPPEIPLNEKMRFTVEYLPRLPISGNAASSGTHPLKRAAVVKAHFRGRSQVLLQAEALDGGPFKLQVDRLDGEPAIQVEYVPHYNNAHESWWIWDEARRRFLRLYRAHRQGC